MSANPQTTHRIADVLSSAIRQLGMRQMRAVALIAPCAMLASCQEGVLDPHGPIGLAERTILSDATAVMLAVVIPVIVLTLVFAWWFRADNRLAKYTPDWEYSGRIELIIWAVPALLIAFLGGMAWISSHDLDPPKPLISKVAPIEVEVVSLDWRWLFIYPEQRIATVNQLMVPVGVPVHFRLTSTSVMNSFFIPQLGSQIYTMPGMTTQLNLEADAIGTYKGISAQFSGDGFADMQFAVDATTPEQFRQWVAATQQAGGDLDQVRLAGLIKPTHAGAPLTFGHVDPEIFNIVATGKIATRWSPEEAR